MSAKPALAISNSAKLLSPFRYPGGKTWLVPMVCQWLRSMETRPSKFVEPFAGGAIVGLNVAFKRLADHVDLVELDDEVAAVWRTIIDGDAKQFAERIATFGFSRISVEKILSETSTSLEDKAFRTLLRNRVSRAGILAPGAGILRQGENRKGLGSRWYPDTLARRVLEVEKMRDRITFTEGDGRVVLRQHSRRSVTDSAPHCHDKTASPPLLSSEPQTGCGNAVFFIDPPYSVGSKAAGRRLYKHCDLNHEELFKIVYKLTGDFLMTYANDEKVRGLAGDFGFDTQEIAMRSSHHRVMTELLVGRDLSWVRSSQDA